MSKASVRTETEFSMLSLIFMAFSHVFQFNPNRDITEFSCLRLIAYTRVQPFLFHCHWLFPSITDLTHWGRVTHICVGEVTIIVSDNGLSYGRRQAIIWTNAGILLIRPLATNFSEISIGIQTFSFKKMHFKMSSAKWRQFCLGLNALNS